MWCRHVRHSWRLQILFWSVVVVVYLHRVPCPRAEGGAYNSTGRGVRACNTFWALRRPGGSKAPVQSFPGSTFPTRAQGMVLEAVVDPNVWSCTVPVIMRGRERSLSGKIKPAFGYRSGRGSSLVVGRGEVYSLALRRDGGHPFALGAFCPWVRRGWPKGVGRDGGQPFALGALCPRVRRGWSKRRRARRRPALCPRARRGWPKGVGRDGGQPFALGRSGAGPKASGETEASPLPSGPFALG